jgi:hypothetical protein
VETITCPPCGGRTDYDPALVAWEMRAEPGDGRLYWCAYCRVRCAHCGVEGLALRRREELP